MSKTIGIDLGTTNSVVAFKDVTVRPLQTGPNNEELCRSCVGIDKNGNTAVGNHVYKNWKRYAPNIVVSAKRLMGASLSDPMVLRMKQDTEMYPFGIDRMSGGTDEAVAILMAGREFTPQQISAEVLRALKQGAESKLNDEVTHAVITVPAYFNEKQKTATRQAAEMAGLKVQQLLAEPTAAAISYGADKMAEGESKVFVVYDFGGGTFDLSILVAAGGQFIESGTGGDRWLGGDNIDQRLIDYVLDRTGSEHGVNMRELIDELPARKLYAFIGELKNQVEDAKKQLSGSQSASIIITDLLETDDGDAIDVDVEISRSEYEAMIRPLIERTIQLTDQLLTDKSFPIEEIDAILLVGGSSCIPLVRQMLAEKYGKEKVLCSEKPMLAVAEGAAILSQSLGTVMECPGCGKSVELGADRCPHCGASMAMAELPATDGPGAVGVQFTTKHRYFIETRTDADEVQYTEIIADGEALPHEKSRTFHTIVDNQKIIEVKLYNDAEDGKYEKICSGFFTISDNLPAGSDLQFTFTLSADEVMSVKVRVPSTDQTTKVRLGRGGKDQHCLDAMSAMIRRVGADKAISSEGKQAFQQKLQSQIEQISSHDYADSADVWQQIEDTMHSALQSASAPDDNSDYPVAFAKILLGNFAEFMLDTDVKSMRAKLAETQGATGLSRTQNLKELEEMTNKYGLFISGYILDIVSRTSPDPVKAQKAAQAFTQFMGAVREGEVPRACKIVDANRSLMEGDDDMPVIDITTGLR